MLNNDKVIATVISYTNATDGRGIPHTTQSSTTRDIEISVYKYTQTKTDDIRFTDVEYVGITNDKSLTDANDLLIGTVKYKILMPPIIARRRTVVYLKVVR